MHITDSHDTTSESNGSGEVYDAIVIGGGPGGSTAATYLACSARRVLVLEKENFPRFHIGESLLPYSQPIFDEMGVWEKLERCGFPRKTGAQFHLSDGSKSLKFVFREGKFTRHTEILQVERSVFDNLLLDHAAESGAEVRQGWSVKRFTPHAGGHRVVATDPTGNEHTFESRFLIDCSGRGNVTGNQEHVREFHPGFRKVAVFGHYAGVKLDAGEKAGDTVIIRMEDRWFWIIPIGTSKISVGCVLDQEAFREMQGTPAELLGELVASSPAMRDRMRHARPCDEVRVTTDFSYYNRRLVGQRLLRVGDAAGFMDPIFSAGVFLAMYSGRLAARVVDRSLAEGSDGSPHLVEYDRRVFTAMKFYWEMVREFYTTPFMEIFMSPRPKWDIPSAVNAILAGEVDGGWRLHWRLRVFFWLIKLQARYSIQPRITF